MNIYVVTEGKSEKIVYPSWIQYINPDLIPVEVLDDVRQNNFYLVSARGYPQIFDVIDSAIEDVNTFLAFDRLVISVDSDEMTFSERMQEINDYLAGKNCRVEIRIIIQHFCFETWALGNRQIIRRKPQANRIRNYINIFDVRVNDPELLPSNDLEDLNRSQFAERYLRAMLNDRYSRLTYTKGNPTVLLSNSYFSQVRNRFLQTNHISSFSTFLDAFI